MSWSDGGMGLRLDLKLSQKLVMTPQLQQAIKLLQLSRLEIDQVINQEMVENPLLEGGDLETTEEKEQAPAAESEVGDAEGNLPEKKEEFDLKWEEYYTDDYRDEGWSSAAPASDDERPSYEQTLATNTSLFDHLIWQLGLSLVTDGEKDIGSTLIGEINDNGYLDTPPEEIATSSGASYETVEHVLSIIQGFDPAGVGARSLQECLLIQVRQLNLSDSLVETIIKNHLGDLEKKRFSVIAKACDTQIQDVLHASKVIGHLEPKPGRPFTSSQNMYITPDLYVSKKEGKYVVLLDDDGLPKLKISPYYRGLLRSKGKVNEDTKSYLNEKLKSALWLVRSIEQRNRTIQLVGNSILKFQYEFMEKGVSALKPLILRQVADDISMHESTVSRVTTNKYMHTPQGIYELKFFFNSSLPRAGSYVENLSSIAVREMIRKMVSEENPTSPLKDQEIVNRLKTEGVKIARRTVTKYRAWLKIPPANRRKTPC